jgi:ACS family tartrate transporter-like MFS transporter
MTSGINRQRRVGVVAVVMALTIVNIGISSAKPPLWSMPTLFLSGSAAAAGIATINSIGNLAASLDRS